MVDISTIRHFGVKTIFRKITTLLINGVKLVKVSWTTFAIFLNIFTLCVNMIVQIKFETKNFYNNQIFD